MGRKYPKEMRPLLSVETWAIQLKYDVEVLKAERDIRKAHAHPKEFYYIMAYKSNSSWFNGGHWTASDYSSFACSYPQCNYTSRTKAVWTETASRTRPEFTKDERAGLVLKYLKKIGVIPYLKRVGVLQ